MAALQIARLKKTFDGKTVLDVENLSFETGKCHALLGDNGSGKSTLLRILAGIIEADQAQIDMAGIKSIAYMPQKPYPFRMPAWKSSLLGSGKSGGDRRAAGEKILESMGLGSLAFSQEAKLSGGEGQRVAFARLMNLNRELLLLDEPTSAMDKEGTLLAENLLKKYMCERKATVLIATHSATQAVRVADSAIIIGGGTVTFAGDVKEVAGKRI